MFKRSKNLILILVVVLLFFLSACQQTLEPVGSDTALPSGWHEVEIMVPGSDEPQTIMYEAVNGYAFFEGDIILGEVDAQGNLAGGELSAQGVYVVSTIGNPKRWELGNVNFTGRVPYVFNSNLTESDRTNIAAAMAHWEQKTPINFVDRTTQTDYVEFIRGIPPDGESCSSYVGRKGGKQQFILSARGNCNFGELLHGMGHTVGLFHEHNRSDRNQFITINWANIQPGREPNFCRVGGPVPSGEEANHCSIFNFKRNTRVGNYDYDSVMHYRTNAFSRNSLPTITTIPAGIPIGRRNGLSLGDINTVTGMYDTTVKHPRFVTDVTGDLKADLIAFGNDGVYVSKSTGSGFTEPERWIADYGHNTDATGVWYYNYWNLALMGDVNGDGKRDIVGFGYDGAYSSLSTGTSFTPANRVVIEFGYDQGWRLDMHPRFLADVNNDNKQDIVGFANDGVYVSLSTTVTTATVPTFTPASKWLEGLGFSDFWRVEKHPRLLADINADGKQDIVAFGDAGVWTALSTGTGFTPASFVLAEFGYGPTGGTWRVEKNPRLLADVNGDQRPDIVGFANDGGAYVSLSTGDGGFSPISNWSPEGFLGWQVDKHPRLLTNIDGNNRRDILGFGDAGVWVALSASTSFAPNTFWLADFGFNDGWRINKNPRFLADVNGDRKPDIVGFGDDGVWTALTTPTGFNRANFVLAKYGYNDGWR